MLASFLSVSLFAQRTLKELSFKNCHNSEFFRTVKNNTRVLKYTSDNGSVLEIGDTLVIGTPNGSITATAAAGGGSGSFGVARASSRTKSHFSTIVMGKPAGFGNIVNMMAGEAPSNASYDMQGEVVVIASITAYHKGSRKKPLAVSVLLGEPNGRAFGINKYMSASNYEKSVLNGELKSLNAPLTRNEAIAKLKESKELLDLGLMDNAEYEQLKKELAPIIMNK